MQQIQLPLELKEELETLAKDKNMTIDMVIKGLLETNKPQKNLAESLVNKKNATNVPSVIRHQFDIKPGHTLFWDILDGEICFKSRRTSTTQPIMV